MRATKTVQCRIRTVERRVRQRYAVLCSLLWCYMDTGRNCMVQCGAIRRVAVEYYVALSRCAAVFPAFCLLCLLPLSPSQTGIDPTLARVLLVLGCPDLCRRVAPSRRLREASLCVCPWQTEAPHHAPMTRQNDSRHGGAAAGSQDPDSLYGRCRRTGHVLWPFTRPTAPGPEPCLLAPLTGRTPPRVACLEPGCLGAHVFLCPAPRRGCAPPQLAPPYGTPAPAPADACRRPPAPVHERRQPAEAGLAHDDLCRGPTRWGSRAPAPQRHRKCPQADPRQSGQRPSGPRPPCCRPGCGPHCAPPGRSTAPRRGA